jgi:hypothetical protein
MSLALFADKDTVTNRQRSSMADITLIEPNWLATGQKKAKKLEPGMTIEKDPQVVNDGEAGVYIRMQVQITDASGNQLATDSDRYQAILASVYCKGDSEAVTLLKKTDDGLVSQNPNFIYKDGWFYYQTKENKYIVLKSGETTPTLFDYLQVPVLKSEYNGIFDSDFNINVIAQAVAATYEGDDIGKAFASLEGTVTDESTGTGNNTGTDESKVTTENEVTADSKNQD